MKVRLVPCFECFGTGLVHVDTRGFMSSENPCPVCKGEGEFPMTDREPKQTIEQQLNEDKQSHRP